MMTIFYMNLIVSILLLVVGFIVPPTGVIDGSVLQAVGLLLLFSIVEKVPEAIRAGRSLKIRKGDMSAEISSDPPDPPDSLSLSDPPNLSDSSAS